MSVIDWTPPDDHKPIHGPQYPLGGIMRHLLHENDGYPIVNGGKPPEFIINKCLTKEPKFPPAMEVITELIKKQSQKMADKFDDLVKARLTELGYDTSNMELMAKRCTIIIKEGDPVREMYVDYGRDTQQLIAYYTDPVTKGPDWGESADRPFTFQIEFTFGPMPLNHED